MLRHCGTTGKFQQPKASASWDFVIFQYKRPREECGFICKSKQSCGAGGTLGSSLTIGQGLLSGHLYLGDL